MSDPRPEPQTAESRAITVRAPAERSAGGETATATVESLAHDARGVARVAGKATFIEGALPGERVRFRYHKRRARYDTGAALEILETSPDRVAAPCGYFGLCGGCTLQHMAPSAQVRAKERVLADTLQHLGRVQPQRWLLPIEAGDLGYRRRARLGVRFVEKKGGVLIGFRERRRSYITALASCLTLDPRLSALLAGLQRTIAQLSRPDRTPQVEVSAGDDTCAVVVRHLLPLPADDLASLRAFGDAHRVGVYLQPGDPRTVRPLWPESGMPLAYALPPFDVTLAFGPTDFIQINAEVNRALVERAVALLEPRPDQRVLDLFCGLGNFTLPLARRAGRVVGCESDPALVRRARDNARANGIENADFRAVDLYRGADDRIWGATRYDALLLDPPRAGAMDVIKSMPAEGPRRVAYVSCNPATLARDSQYLVHVLGYRMEAAGVADMFPHTSHVESIALYVRA